MDKTFTVTIEPAQVSFAVKQDETILAAAKRQGLYLPHSCCGGFCGVCKTKMNSGTVEHESYDTKYALPDEEKNQNMILTCRAKAHSDLVLELPELTAENMQQKVYNTTVASVEYIHDVAIFELQLESGQSFDFQPGQYIDIVLQDGQSRSYSIANASNNTGRIKLHARAQNNGLFSNYAFNYMKTGHMVQIKGPYGNFTYQKENAKQSVIFLASGTGFAPVNSILETLATYKPEDQPIIYFYWGARKLDDLYLLDVAKAFADKLSRYYFVPVLSEPLPQDNWTGRTGLVHQAVLDDFVDLQFYDVYACGAPAMIDAAYTSFTKERALPVQAFHSDVFSAAVVTSKK